MWPHKLGSSVKGYAQNGLRNKLSANLSPKTGRSGTGQRTHTFKVEIILLTLSHHVCHQPWGWRHLCSGLELCCSGRALQCLQGLWETANPNKPCRMCNYAGGICLLSCDKFICTGVCKFKKQKNPITLKPTDLQARKTFDQSQCVQRLKPKPPPQIFNNI